MCMFVCVCDSTPHVDALSSVSMCGNKANRVVVPRLFPRPFTGVLRVVSVLSL